MKSCRVCNVDLSQENTTWYRQKNYVHLCNDCNREEKHKQSAIARAKNPEFYNGRSFIHRNAMKTKNPVRYTAQQARGSAKKRAAALGLDYDLTSQFIESIANTHCPILGVELKYGGGDRADNSATLDRIDPNQGYVKNNVQIISFKANLMKSNASPSEMLRFARWAQSAYGVREIIAYRSFEKTKGVAREN